MGSNPTLPATFICYNFERAFPAGNARFVHFDHTFARYSSSVSHFWLISRCVTSVFYDTHNQKDTRMEARVDRLQEARFKLQAVCQYNHFVIRAQVAQHLLRAGFQDAE